MTHPPNSFLLLQYFRLELMYVDQLKKREEILLGGDKAGRSEASPAPAPAALPADESRDAVMEGAVAVTVFDFAAEKVPDDDGDKTAFLASMLDVALDFEFARGKDDAVRRHIEKWVNRLNDH